MAFIILRDIAKNIKDSIFYSIAADEVTDCSNKEQFTICFGWVDKGFNTHEDFFWVDALVIVIKDALIRLNIPLSNAPGQCYDGAKNMCGIKNGVSNKNFIRKSKGIFHTFFSACFKFGCWRYGEECSVFQRHG